MDLGDLISQDAVIPSLKVRSKKQALLELSARACELIKIDSREIFDVLLQRERLGSTGVGRGIAIPHGKLAPRSSIFSMFARLDTPIEFDAMDDEPVDLIFLLLAPEHAGADHLKALARISRLLREPSAIEKLRNSTDNADIYATLTEKAAASHAA